MAEEPDGQDGVSGRTLLTVKAPVAVGGAGVAGLNSWPQPVPVTGLHLQFGADASTEMVVSWHAPEAVANPRVMLGTPEAGLGRMVVATPVSYVDALSGTEVCVMHARIDGLDPDTEYVYAAWHDGATPERGSFRTAPDARIPLRFTSFGDQSTPKMDLRAAVDGSDNRGSPAAADVTAAVERLAPLFNLVNGDLCYANMSADRVGVWSDWFENNSRSARHRPWMPAAGNHENELGNGPVGFAAYQAYFALPEADPQPEMSGLWYSFRAGSVKVISLNNDDVCFQDGGDSYVRGYSGGAQKRWLESELKAARDNRRVDWIVVCMHQTAISTGRKTNGADFGLRAEWLPLFDAYGVDLVVCGHEHHYERSHPVRGTTGTDTLTPQPVSTRLDVIDTSAGTVHLVIGGGGTSIASNHLLFERPRCRVLTAVGDVDPDTGRRAPIYREEDAPWSAFRDPLHPYGFVCFDVDPGVTGGQTSIRATYYAVDGPGEPIPVDEFTLVRPRRDGG
jgi:3',5'-cyclic AMP phosphodiesterase CpdA